MIPGQNTTLSLILIALGFLGVILSFMVTDRKKSLISLVLAGIIIVVGLFQYGSQSLSRNRWKQRMQQIQQDRQVDLEELRNKLRNKAAETKGAAQNAQPK